MCGHPPHHRTLLRRICQEQRSRGTRRIRSLGNLYRIMKAFRAPEAAAAALAIRAGMQGGPNIPVCTTYGGWSFSAATLTS